MENHFRNHERERYEENYPTMKTVSAVTPAEVKAEASAVLATHGISMAAFLREFLARVAAGDKVVLARLVAEGKAKLLMPADQT